MTSGGLSAEQVTQWIEHANAELSEFVDHTFPDDVSGSPQEVAEGVNRLIEFTERLGSLNERFGFTPTRDEFREIARRAFHDQAKRELGPREMRTMLTGILYQNSYRLPDCTDGTPAMTAAMEAAEVFRLAMLDAGDAASDLEFGEAFERRFEEVGYTARKDDAAAVRKSIQRYKTDKRRPQFLYYFNPETYRLEVVDGASLLHGMHRQKGRPRKN